MCLIRAGEARDIEALYAISLATGDAGGDASHLYHDPKLIGHIYAAPYLMVDGGFAFVAEDEDGVCGYVVGTADTRAFAGKLERDWWPALRRRYRPASDLESADARRIHLIHHPEIAPVALTRAFPAHLHMNLLPRARGQGLGARLLARALEALAGAGDVHVGVNAGNERAKAFWLHMGFVPLGDRLDLAGARAVYLGRPVAETP